MDQIQATGIVGASYVFVERNQIVFQNSTKLLEYAPLEEKALPMGTLSQILITLACYKLREEDKLKFENKVIDYLPSLKLGGYGKETALLVKHLINGTSGLNFKHDKILHKTPIGVYFKPNELLRELKAWFEKIWKDETNTKDVKDEVLAYLKKLYQENSPEFIYLKTLYHIFQDWIQDQSSSIFFEDKIGFFETEIWNMLYDFQKDGVKAAINKIQNYNGCIIADSVGLGKTFEALAIIRYFELKNYKVLVICPKRLKENWTIYQSSKNNILNPFKKDKFNYHILFHTDMGQEKGKSGADGHDFETFNWGAYDLIVIDESHNFRGNPMQKGNKLNRVAFLLEKVIQQGVNTKVLLLSATPVNNTLHDLRNQILLIAKGQRDFFKNTLGISDIATTIQNAQTCFTNWANEKSKNPNVKVEDLISKLEDGFFTLLDSLTIARSRKQIREFYEFKQKFPKRLRPISVYPKLDLQNRLTSYEEIESIIQNYKLSLFQPYSYVQEEKKQKYLDQAKQKGFITDERSFRGDYLIGMMKVNFLKRLESSIHSFRVSMFRTIEKINDLLSKIEQFQESKRNQTLTPILIEDPDEEEDLTVGQKLEFELQDLNLEKWKEDLLKDKQAIQTLYQKAKEIQPESDAKLSELKKIIFEKVQKFSIQNITINPNNKKLLIFTAFSDTAKYLYENLKDYVHKELKLEIALVTGTSCDTTFGKQDFQDILRNFSPISKNRNGNPNQEIDILIATDCISEGQNLQDCDTVINYDIHWNPVRIIQRFGRIDRLGSKNENIMLVNFWPVKDLDKYINLKERVEAKMALVDLTATADDNLLSPTVQDNIQAELSHRDKQLRRLKEEVLDLEEIDENPYMTDFNLDSFRQDLLNYLKSKEKELSQAPLGMLAHVPSPSQKEFANLQDYSNIPEVLKQNSPRGVIFCLKRKDISEKTQLKNPLSPYFLIYVKEDKSIQWKYTQARQILEIYRSLCLKANKPYEELCSLFNQNTKNGKEVDKYNQLLLSAIDSLNEQIQKANLDILTKGGRGDILLFNSAKFENLETYELITWLVVW